MSDEINGFCVEGGVHNPITFDIDHDGLCAFWMKYVACSACRYFEKKEEKNMEIEMCLCGTKVRFDQNNVCPVCGRQYDGDKLEVVNIKKVKEE